MFGAEVADICGREEQLPAVTHAIVHLLHGDALRAHNIFQDDVSAATLGGWAVTLADSSEGRALGGNRCAR